jgi:hypothetical protein
VPVFSFFSAGRAYSWPPSFSTSCEGSCAGGNGWRLRGDYVDSGFFGGPMDSTLALALDEIPVDGELTFNYAVDPQPGNVLQVFVDEELVQAIPSGIGSRDLDDLKARITLPAKDGATIVTFDWHQEVEGAPFRLSNLIVEGARGGGANAATPCPPGSSSSAGATACDPCPKGQAAPAEGSASCEPCEEDSYADHEGSPQCVACGSRVHAESGASQCSSCWFNDTATGLIYNVTDLKPVVGIDSLSILLSICDPVLTCDGGQSHVCDTSDTSYGSRMNYALPTDARFNKSIGASFAIVYDRASAFECSDGVTETWLYMVCQLPMVMRSSWGAPMPLHSTACRTELVWYTPYGCPACQRSDYERAETQCTNGKELVTYLRKSRCNGPDILLEQEETCTVSYSFSWIVVLIVLVVIVTLILGLGWFIYRNRRLEVQYVRLSGARKPELQSESDI